MQFYCMVFKFILPRVGKYRSISGTVTTPTTGGISDIIDIIDRKPQAKPQAKLPAHRHCEERSDVAIFTDRTVGFTIIINTIWLKPKLEE